MDTYNVKRHFNHMNRLIIVLLTGIGLGIDGYQIADSVFFLSVVLWLWLDEINNIEVICVEKIYSVISAHSVKI